MLYGKSLEIYALVFHSMLKLKGNTNQNSYEIFPLSFTVFVSPGGILPGDIREEQCKIISHNLIYYCKCLFHHNLTSLNLASSRPEVLNAHQTYP